MYETLKWARGLAKCIIPWIGAIWALATEIQTGGSIQIGCDGCLQHDDHWSPEEALYFHIKKIQDNGRLKRSGVDNPSGIQREHTPPAAQASASGQPNNTPSVASQPASSAPPMRKKAQPSSAAEASRYDEWVKALPAASQPLPSLATGNGAFDEGAGVKAYDSLLEGLSLSLEKLFLRRASCTDYLDGAPSAIEAILRLRRSEISKHYFQAALRMAATIKPDEQKLKSNPNYPVQLAEARFQIIINLLEVAPFYNLTPKDLLQTAYQIASGQEADSSGGRSENKMLASKLSSELADFYGVRG